MNKRSFLVRIKDLLGRPVSHLCEEERGFSGWERLFSERLYIAFHRNYGLDVRVARFHNIFGPEGTWEGGREKAPAAFCRKVIEAQNGSTIKMWGDGKQTRSFLYIDECLEAIGRLMDSNFIGPIKYPFLIITPLSNVIFVPFELRR